MTDRRPRMILLVLTAAAAVGFLGSAVLDVHGDWGDPRQAVANVCWFVFLFSVVGLLVTGARVLLRRRHAADLSR